MTRSRRHLITVHVDRKRAKELTHHPITRVFIFASMIVVSVILTEIFIRSHYAAFHLGAVAVGSFVARLLEVLTDCVCDRMFPS